MIVNHKPATALPWQRGGNTNIDRADGAGVLRALYVADEPAQNAIKNADYTLHAANTYPKLVERVREDLRQLGHVAAALRVDGRNVGSYTKMAAAVHLEQVEASIEALLAELGEQS